MIRRAVGSPRLFAIIWVSLASTLYFSLGIVADHALGLTPVVFLFSVLFFALSAMTYVEGASLHQERAGSTVFARHAFNELWSFLAGWAIVLDFLILLSVTSFVTANYLGAFWGDLGRDELELAVSVAVVAYVGWRNLRGAGRPRYTLVVAADILLQVAVVVVGLALFAGDLDVLTDSIDVGEAPEWDELVFALTLGTVVVTCLESASGLAGEVRIGRRGLRRLVSGAVGSVLVVYIGIAVVAATAIPVVDGGSPLAEGEAPVIDVVGAFDPGWATDALRYAVAGIAVAMLVLAANAAMLGLSRLGYALATNRQIPSAVGRLHPRWGTPYVIIAIAVVLAVALAATKDLEFLVGLYAFGSLVSVLIAHLSICRLRFLEPRRPRPYRIPLGVRIGAGVLPLPAVVGAVVSFLAFVAVLVYHEGARYVGGGWMLGGVVLYVVYRTTTGKPLLKNVSVPEAALRAEAAEVQYGSILVPVSGSPIDDDIIQAAGRLAASQPVDKAEGPHAMIEALFVFEIPVTLPIDSRLPDEQLRHARSVLARAKAVGEEYEGVEVATATARGRRAGEAIVAEARRRGVEAILMAAEEPSSIRGGARLGGVGGPLDNFVGEATKYVVRKAPCRVILTAPPSVEPDG